MNRSAVVALVIAATAAVLGAAPEAFAAPSIATAVGNGTSAFTGDGGRAVNAQISGPTDVTAIPAGGYYIADQGNQRIRKVDSNGDITTVAGNGVQGYSGDGGPATQAAMNAPSSVAILPDGSILIADANNNAIRKVDTSGIITTVAGMGPGFPGFAGDGGPATSARLSFPYAMAVYPDGSYLIADSDNARVRKVSSLGIITTVAGGGGGGDGSLATNASLIQPKGLTLTPSGGYLIADYIANKVREVSSTGVISTAAGDGVGDFSGDGGPATAARLNGPIHVQYNVSDGYYLIADRTNSRIRKVTAADGKISTLTGDGTTSYGGDGGPPEGGKVNYPFGMTFANDQAVLIADTGNHRVRRIFSGTQAPGPGAPAGPIPATNEKPPFISDVFVTKTLPRYLCDAGLWGNIVGGFSYSWYRLDRATSIFTTVGRWVKVSSNVVYDLPAADKGKSFYCIASAKGADGKTLSVSSPIRTLTGQKTAIQLVTTKTYGNVQVRGIDVFQTVQPEATTQTFGWDRRTFFGLCGGGTPTAFSPGANNTTSPCGSSPEQRSTNPQDVVYNGVNIDAQKDATAVVYVNTTEGPPADPNAKLLLRLRGRVKGKTLSEVMTTTITGVRERAEKWVTESERGSSSSAFRVRIPWSWLNAAASDGNLLELEATVSISVADSGFQECGTFGPAALALGTAPVCSADNTFKLSFIPVRNDLPNLQLRTLPLNGTRQKAGKALADPNSVLRVVTDIFPGGNRFRIEPFSSPIDISGADSLKIDDDGCKAFKEKGDLRGCKMANIGALVNTWLASDVANRTGYDALVGVHNYAADGGDEPGWKPGGFELRQTDNVPRLFVNDGTMNRPFTAAAHEFGHLLNAPHADQAAPDPISGSGCGGNSNGQVGEAWPPDNTGRLWGYAFGLYDGKTGSRRGTETNQDRRGVPNLNFALWDFMSYCAPEHRAWISPKNWKRYFDELEYLNKRGRPSFRTRAQATAAASGQSFAVGTVGPGGATIDRVVPAHPGNSVPGSVPSSTLKVTAFGANGQPIGTTGADVRTNEDGPAGAGSFTAPLPSGAVAVEAQSGGQTVARIQRTTPPKVKVLSPGRRTRVNGGKRSVLVVKWRTTDPDSPKRLARVQYAADGRSYRTVWQGPDTGRASVPGRTLAYARKARVRVIVNDGFSDATARSAPFRAAGSAPVVTITAPTPGGARSTSARTLLKGYAIDDRGKSLQSLTWYAGRKRLGRGATLKAKLPAGKVNLRLVARDRRGRTTTARRTVQVASTPFYVTTLSVPQRVAPGAKRVTIRFAASERAKLRVGKRSISVGTKARTIRLTLPSKPKLGAIALKYTVRTSGGKSVKGTVRVNRL